MALLPRRSSLLVMIAVGALGLQPLVAGQAVAATSLGTPSSASLSPNSGSSPVKDAVLSWADVSGAQSYQVELSRSDDFSDTSDQVTLPDDGDAPTASFPVPQTLAHGVYFWHVRAVGGGATGPWSDAAQIDKAWDVAPSTSGSTPGTDPTVSPTSIASAPWRFAWTPIADASTYEIEFSNDPSFPAPGTTQSDGATTVACLTTATTLTPANNLDPGAVGDTNVDECDLSPLPTSATYYWRVRGIDDSKTADLKANDQVNDLECAGLDGSDSSSGALGSPTSTGQDCSLWSTERSVSAYTLPSPPDETKPGNVRGLTLSCPQTAGLATAFSCATTPEISWQPTANAADYEVTIADDADFSNIEHFYTTPFLSITPRDQLADYTAGSGYYVAVQACDAACGTASEVTFTKRTPKLTGLDAAKVVGGVRLSWSNLVGRFAATVGAPAVEAEDYQVEVAKATDPNFDSPVITTTVDAACDSTTGVTCFSPAGSGAAIDQAVVEPTTSGSYIWRVSPVDETGNVLPAATDTTPFTVDVTRPAFSITTKSGVAVTGPLTIKVSEPVTGVSTSTVHVVPAGESVTDAVAGTLTTAAAANTWTFRPTKPLATGQTYVLSVDSSVRDQSNNIAEVTGSGVRTTTVAKDSSKGWTYSSGWKTHSASGALSGSYREAAKGSTAKLVVVGTEAKLYACKSPSLGTITVSVGGHTTTVSEHQSFTKCGVEVYHRALGKGPQTVTVGVSKGTGDLDELTVG